MSRNIAVAKQMFQTPALFYVFVLQYTGGSARERLLGITEQHYKSLKISQNWLDNINRELLQVERIVGSEAAEDAREVLLCMYKEMTKRGQ